MGVELESDETHEPPDPLPETHRLARRWLLAGGASLLAGAALPAGAPRSKAAAVAQIPSGGSGEAGAVPSLEFVLEARVTVAAAMDLGESCRGRRRIVPITGGAFHGPGLAGTVLDEGEDTQILRPDGVREICARYVLRTHDGVLIYVVNAGLIARQRSPGSSSEYKRTTPRFDAPPASSYSWLNRAIFVGTLHRLPTSEHAVIVRFFRVT